MNSVIDSPKPYFDFDTNELKNFFESGQKYKNLVFEFLKNYNKDSRDDFFNNRAYIKEIYNYHVNFLNDEVLETNEHHMFLPNILKNKRALNQENLIYFPLFEDKVGIEIIHGIEFYNPSFIAEVPCDIEYFDEIYKSLLGTISIDEAEFCVMSPSQDLFIIVNNPAYIIVYCKNLKILEGAQNSPYIAR